MFSFTSIQIKLIAAAIISVIFLGMAWGIFHYRGLYLDGLKEIGRIEVLREASAKAALSCSESVTALENAAIIRATEAAVAIALAKAEAKKNESFAFNIMTTYPDIATKECPKGDALINQYLDEVQRNETIN